MIRGIIVALLLLITRGGSVIGQVNFVRNGDFEQHSYCPRGWDDIKACTYWSGIDSTGLGNCDVMDYCHACANVSSNIGIPLGEFYFQYPHSGNAFTEVCFYINDNSDVFYRQYLQGRLSEKLSAGKKYCVSFWVCLAEGSKYAIKDIGAYLDNGIIDTATICGAPQIKYTPQIVNTGNIITDTVNWTKIEGTFTAKGDEQFITIGNFKDNTHTTLTTLSTNGYNSSQPYFAFYLVDDVSVTECYGVGVGSINQISQSYTLSPNPNKGIINLVQSALDEHPVRIEVFEPSGRHVYNSIIRFQNNQAALDLACLSSGFYFIRLQDRDGNYTTLRFVKE